MRLMAGSSALLLLAAALLLDGLAPVALRIGLAAAALLPLAFAALARRPVPRPTGAQVEVTPQALVRVTPTATTEVVRWDAPFGVTLLASYGRPVALLAFTSPDRTRYVPVRIEGRSEEEDLRLSRVAVLADLDLVDGALHEPALASAAAAELLTLIERKAADALGRVYLSDGKGLPIALDRGTLSVGGRCFDLTSQLEWRALMFHESTGQAAALYQATAVRQNGAEVVLVAPMPASIVPREPNAHRDASGRLGRALTRDLKLLQAPAEAPPARDLRVAIDRPFMIAVRRALAEAPLATRIAPEPPARRRSTGRDSLA